jgi:hypothetical protein
VVPESGELIAVARATSRVTAMVERIFNLKRDSVFSAKPYL